MRAGAWRSLAALPVAAVVLLAAAPAIAPAPHALDGYILTQRITSEGAQAMSMTMRIKVAQGHVRIDLDNADLAQMGGMYMLTRDDGRITAVLGSQGMAIIMDPAMVGSGQAMGGFAPPAISDVVVSVDDLGAGEPLLGYPTHKYRIHSTYKMTTAAGASTYQSTIDASMATEMPALAEGLQKFADSFGSAFNGLAGGGTKDYSAAMQAKMPKGYTLKAVVKSTETTAAGQSNLTSMTIEVTDVSKSAIEASEFELPAGIKVMDMAQMMGGRGGI